MGFAYRLRDDGLHVRFGQKGVGLRINAKTGAVGVEVAGADARVNKRVAATGAADAAGDQQRQQRHNNNITNTEPNNHLI